MWNSDNDKIVPIYSGGTAPESTGFPILQTWLDAGSAPKD
jgi:hypothetical protein